MLNGLCWDDGYTIAQWLKHRWLQARVPGSNPGSDSQFCLRFFPFASFPQTSEYPLLHSFHHADHFAIDLPLKGLLELIVFGLHCILCACMCSMFNVGEDSWRWQQQNPQGFNCS